eukprot:2832582-Rhodomonas_salina.3
MSFRGAKQRENARYDCVAIELVLGPCVTARWTGGCGETSGAISQAEDFPEDAKAQRWRREKMHAGR